MTSALGHDPDDVRGEQEGAAHRRPSWGARLRDAARSPWMMALLLVAVTAGALALRLPNLALPDVPEVDARTKQKVYRVRPLHNDEAVNADKVRVLLETGEFEYDKVEYHGPTLYYLTLPSLWMSGVRSYEQSTEFHYRVVPVVFGALLVLLLWPLRDALTPGEMLVAAALLAVSPAMVFYSRYYIHEVPLVAFTALAVAAGWRYARGGGLGSALACGAALGLMWATKETWVIALFAMAVALVACVLWARLLDGRPASLWPLLNWRALAGLAAFAAVAYALFSSFLANPQGPIDAVSSYRHYYEKGVGSAQRGEHDQPFGYYLKLLAHYHYGGRAPVRSEALILALAGVGVLAALAGTVRWRRPLLLAAVGLRRRDPLTRATIAWADLPEDACEGRSNGRGRVGAGDDDDDDDDLDEDGDGAHAQATRPTRADLLRFLAIFTLVTTLVYSLITYKTPWCMLTFLWGMILLAGVGAGTLLKLAPSLWPGERAGWTARGRPLVLIVALICIGGAYLVARLAGDDILRWSEAWSAHRWGAVRAAGEALARAAHGPTPALGLTLAIGSALLALCLASPRLAMAAVLVVPAIHLGRQAVQINHEPRQVASAVYNPYVYSQPATLIYELPARLEELAAVSPRGRKLPVTVTVPAPWPLPWYLRRFPNVGYPEAVEGADLRASVIIAASEQVEALESVLKVGDDEPEAAEPEAPAAPAQPAEPPATSPVTRPATLPATGPAATGPVATTMPAAAASRPATTPAVTEPVAARPPATRAAAAAAAAAERRFAHGQSYHFRPGVNPIWMYVERGLWDKFLETRTTPKR